MLLFYFQNQWTFLETIKKLKIGNTAVINILFQMMSRSLVRTQLDDLSRIFKWILTIENQLLPCLISQNIQIVLETFFTRVIKVKTLNLLKKKLKVEMRAMHQSVVIEHRQLCRFSVTFLTFLSPHL